MKKKLASVRVFVFGFVQGVSFRAFTQDIGKSLGLTGYAMNLPDGESVEVFAEGDKKKLEELLEYLKTGPPGASVRGIKTEWAEYSGKYREFIVK